MPRSSSSNNGNFETLPHFPNKSSSLLIKLVLDAGNAGDYRTKTNQAQSELAKKDHHIGQVEKTVANELAKSKNLEVEAKRMMNKVELKVSKVEAKLFEAKANYDALTSKVKGLVEEHARTEDRENKIHLEIFHQSQDQFFSAFIDGQNKSFKKGWDEALWTQGVDVDSELFSKHLYVPQQLLSFGLSIHPIDPVIPKTPDVNPNLVEFGGIEDLLSNLGNKGVLERRRGGVGGASGGSGQEGGAEN
ncbi:unnamed protein product [Ilex paraguariensis]|uniref:Uncharacterized protein n=1 Tax=Ilex paraguariensis TaxID=185542 RepID=A0ABC8UXB5_9AQUA